MVGRYELDNGSIDFFPFDEKTAYNGGGRGRKRGRGIGRRGREKPMSRSKE